MYETGRMSVGSYADEAELKAALQAHHNRAKTGEPGGPVGAPAERIAAVYIYDKHPNEFNPEQTASADVLSKEVAGLVKALSDDNGVVAIDRLAVEVRGLSHPMLNDHKGFDSFFKVKEQKALDLAFLED